MYLKGRAWVSNSWFILQVVTIARSGPGWNQEPGIPPDFSMCVLGTNHLDSYLLLSSREIYLDLEEPGFKCIAMGPIGLLHTTPKLGLYDFTILIFQGVLKNVYL